jgi:hypothetical protein
VLLDLRLVEASYWIRREHPSDEVPCFCAEEVWQHVFRGQNFSIQGWGVLVLEWKVAAEHGEEDDPAAPNITLRRNILLTSDHLGGGITR